MKNFKDTLLALIDNGASQAKGFIESFNDVVNSFDMDAQLEYFNEKKKELIKRGNELFGEFAELLKQVKESITDFTVTVPFDESIGEKISYKINNDGRLFIEVTFENANCARTNKTSVVIPSNCDLEKASLSINKTAKTATVIIPKVVVEPTKEEAAPTEKPKKTVRKKTAKKTVEAEEAPSNEESMTHISSKLAKKLKQNGAKYSQMMHRDSNGRFVRRVPNTEAEQG